MSHAHKKVGQNDKSSLCQATLPILGLVTQATLKLTCLTLWGTSISILRGTSPLVIKAVHNLRFSNGQLVVFQFLVLAMVRENFAGRSALLAGKPVRLNHSYLRSNYVAAFVAK